MLNTSTKINKVYWSLRDIADELGVSKHTIIFWISNHLHPYFRDRRNHRNERIFNARARAIIHSYHDLTRHDGYKGYAAAQIIRDRHKKEVTC